MSGVYFRDALIVLCSVLGSGGLWSFLQFKSSRGNAETRLLMGVGYDKITTLGLVYINRGSITKDEYEDFCKYYYEPYAALGGNGVAERVMHQVKLLPWLPHTENPAIFTNGLGRTTASVQLVNNSGSQAPPQ
jgi:hypothetical protein